MTAQNTEPSSLEPEQCAVLVVDMQNDFVHPDGVLAAMGFDLGPNRSVLAPLAVFLDKMRALGVRIVFIAHESDPMIDAGRGRPRIATPDGSVAGSGPTACSRGTWGAELAEELEVHPLSLAILGSGSAIPDPLRGNPSQAVVVDDDVLLFDCGERTTVNLVTADINPMDVHHLFLTHHHWDHIADFGYLMMSTWNCGRVEPLRVFGPSGTVDMVHSSIFGVHRADVEFVRNYVKALPDHVRSRPEPDPPYEARDIDVGDELRVGSARVLAGTVEHHQRIGMPSLGYRVDTPYGSVAMSGDSAPCQGMVDLASGVDVLVHDCAFLEDVIEERQMWSHSGPAGAARVAEDAGAGTLVLTHLGPYTSPEPTIEMARMYYGERRHDGIWDEIREEAGRHFSGEVVLAEDGMVLRVG